MKKLYMIAILLLGVSLYGYDYVEVRDSDGTSYYSNRNNSRHYVCYNKRIKVVSDGELYLSYRGCARKRYRCSDYGMYHFGKYPSNSKASDALWRCRNSRPRFVD